MKRTVLLATAAAVVMTMNVSAQGRNFGGTWTIDSEKTIAAGGTMGGGRGGGGVARSGGGGTVVASGTGTTGGVVAVGGGGGGRGGGAVGAGGGLRGAGAAPAGLTLTIDAASFTIAQGQSTTTYRTDGSATNLDTETRKASAKAAWQGDKLLIETTTETPNGPVVTHATWYLEGEWLVRENKSTSQDGTEIVRKTYFKKAASH